MAKYLVLMYGKEMKMPEVVTAEMMEAGTKPWREYLGPLTKKNVLESSAPVVWEGKVVDANGATKEYTPNDTDLLGYMLIKASSMEEAVEIAKKSPHAISKAGYTVIRQAMEVM
jgi:hypothetical protein